MDKNYLSMISPTLYELSMRKVVVNFERFSSTDLRPVLTESMIFDLYWEMFSGGKNQEQIGATIRSDYVKNTLELHRLRTLGKELAKLDVFLR